MGTTFLTNDEWAVRKGYADFDAYAAAKPDSPASATLTGYRDDAYAIIVKYVGSVPTDSADTAYLKRLEYQMIELMIDEEDARSHNLPRPQFMPHDYLYKTDRETLAGMGSFNRRVVF